MLYMMVLLFSSWNLLRVWNAVSWRAMLVEFSAFPPPAVTAAGGAFWLAASLLLLFGLIGKKPWAAYLLAGIGAGYTIWHWLLRQLQYAPATGWGFDVIFNLAIMIFILFNAKALLREAHERKNENHTVD